MFRPKEIVGFVGEALKLELKKKLALVLICQDLKRTLHLRSQ